MEMDSMKANNKKIEFIRWVPLAMVILAVLLFIGYQIYCQRITAISVENKLYYQAEVYCEVIDSHLKIDTGKCLGSVRYELGETCRLYEIKGLPDYLYVSLGWEYRLYRLCEPKDSISWN